MPYKTTANELTVTLEFANNRLLPYLFGKDDSILKRLEEELSVQVAARGNLLQLSGLPQNVEDAKAVLKYCYERLAHGIVLDDALFNAALKASRSVCALASTSSWLLKQNDLKIATGRKIVYPHSGGQKAYLGALNKHPLVFGIGPAGTGKTYLAVAMGVSLLMAGQVERVILSRPAVEAGERLGFLPGDIKEKVDPYLRPLYDALHEMLTAQQMSKCFDSGAIEIAPLAFMRGRTLSKAFIILDEAQNTTPEQMKMFLTRLGADSRMVVTGDLTQIDLPKGIKSGLQDAVNVLSKIQDISFTYLSTKDVMRHSLVAQIIRAYG